MPVGFFETPKAVADQLSALVLSHVKVDEPQLLDACAGRGNLGLAARSHFGPNCKPAFVEIDASLIGSLRERISCERGPAIILQSSIFDGQATALIMAADVILCNPPFVDYGLWVKAAGLVRPKIASRHFLDIACYMLAHIAEFAKPGAILWFIIRRDIIFSVAYSEFRAHISKKVDVLEYYDLDRGLRPRSGAARSIMAVLRRRVNNICERGADVVERALENEGWCTLGSIASVKAGPSARTAIINSPPRGDPVLTIRIPRKHTGDVLWNHTFSRQTNWNVAEFSSKRNLRYQGTPGFAYKLAGSQFRTAILPKSFRFFSDCPAVQPLCDSDLDFVTGCSVITAWTRFVRRIIQSTNFSPSAVANVPVPYFKPALARRISHLGESARILVEEALVGAVPSVEWPTVYRREIECINRQCNAEIEQLLVTNLATQFSELSWSGLKVMPTIRKTLAKPDSDRRAVHGFRPSARSQR